MLGMFLVYKKVHEIINRLGEDPILFVIIDFILVHIRISRVDLYPNVIFRYIISKNFWFISYSNHDPSTVVILDHIWSNTLDSLFSNHMNTK